MNTADRRTKILALLEEADRPLKASTLAAKFAVSRQSIVGDIALLRASGQRIIPTPRGYILERKAESDPNTVILACRHDAAAARSELYAIVDNGGKVVDVIVEHPVYGELTGMLNIENRYDADVFAEKLTRNKALTLSTITDGIHLHTITYRDERSLSRIREALAEQGVLLSPDSL